MERLKKGWFRVPRHIRKPITVIVGFTFVLAAGLTGWIPGPGGIPLFLIGVAILATEFEWAERLRDFVLRIVKWFSEQARSHPVISTVVIVSCMTVAVAVSYGLYLFFDSLRY